jgi:hypothetical protein
MGAGFQACPKARFASIEAKLRDKQMIERQKVLL